MRMRLHFSYSILRILPSNPGLSVNKGSRLSLFARVLLLPRVAKCLVDGDWISNHL